MAPDYPRRTLQASDFSSKMVGGTRADHAATSAAAAASRAAAVASASAAAGAVGGPGQPPSSQVGFS